MAVSPADVRAIVERVCARPEVLDACARGDLGAVIDALRYFNESVSSRRYRAGMQRDAPCPERWRANQVRPVRELPARVHGHLPATSNRGLAEFREQAADSRLWRIAARPEKPIAS
jgi:hypothetical protein